MCGEWGKEVKEAINVYKNSKWEKVVYKVKGQEI